MLGEMYKELYFKYCEELDLYFPEKTKGNKKEYEKSYREFSEDPSCLTLPINDENGELSGFMIVKNGASLNIEGYVFEIVEMYVVPEKRHKGLAMRCATNFLKTCKGKYILVILNTNIGALKFWEKTTKQLGAELRLTADLSFDVYGNISKVYEIDCHSI